MKKKSVIIFLISLFLLVPCVVSAKVVINDRGKTMVSPLSVTTTNVVNKFKCNTEVSSLIKKYWKWVMFLVPPLLIVLITLDFVKAMSSGDSDAIKKSSNNAIKRVIAAILLLALPWMLSVIFGWFGLEICF